MYKLPDSYVLKICASLFWFLSPHLTFAFTSKSYLTFPHLFILISGNSTTSVSRRVSRAEAAAWLVFPQSCQIDITEHLVHSRRHNHFLHPLLLTALCNNPSQILQSSLYVQQWQGCLFSKHYAHSYRVNCRVQKCVTLLLGVKTLIDNLNLHLFFLLYLP